MLGGGGFLWNEAVLHMEAVRHFFADVELHWGACAAGPLCKIDAIVTERVIFSHDHKGLRQAYEIAISRTGAGIPPQLLARQKARSSRPS